MIRLSRARVEQFEFERAMLERLKPCRLNAKHLTELKPRQLRVLH
jgi:hypothetical protein